MTCGQEEALRIGIERVDIKKSAKNDSTLKS